MDAKEYARKQYRAMDSVFSHWQGVFKDARDFIFPYAGKFDGEDNFQRRDENLLWTMM